MALSMAGGIDVIISTHAEQRIRERMNLSSRAIYRAAQNALVRGRKREEFTGPFRKYLDSLYRRGLETQAATLILVYGDNIFLFAGRTLVTMWPMRRAGNVVPEKGAGKTRKAASRYSRW